MPYSTVYTVAGKTSQKVAGKTSQNRYSRTPDSVLFDHQLTASARVIYAFLARHVFEGRVAKVGQRLIATRLGFNRETVEVGLAQLASIGHIVVVGEGKCRRMYILQDELFGQKQGVTTVVRSIPRGKRMVSVAAEDVRGAASA